MKEEIWVTEKMTPKSLLPRKETKENVNSEEGLYRAIALYTLVYTML